MDKTRMYYVPRHVEVLETRWLGAGTFHTGTRHFRGDSDEGIKNLEKVGVKGQSLEKMESSLNEMVNDEGIATIMVLGFCLPSSGGPKPLGRAKIIAI
eukprot:7636194-Pyramimonas_sp.AAC.2